MYVCLFRFDANEVSTDGIEASSDCHIDIQQTTSWTVHHDTKGTQSMIFLVASVAVLFIVVLGRGVQS